MFLRIPDTFIGVVVMAVHFLEWTNIEVKTSLRALDGLQQQTRLQCLPLGQG